MMPIFTPQILYDGTEQPPAERIALRAGPLSLVYEAGDLRYIRLGQHEILRRVYVAVRDQNWNTIPARLSQVVISHDEHSFRMTYCAEHQHGAIDMIWNALITGSADGTICFSMHGHTRSTFLRNRIGFCVLHPIRECAGQPCTIEYDDGTGAESCFPEPIAPHQPFLAMRAICHDVISGVSADVRFTGELFEMEDQRNWTDASFKIYGTPLALPFPVEIPAGTQITQSVTLTLMRSQASVDQIAYQTEALPLLFTADLTAARTRMPRIGLGVASHGQPLSQREQTRLQALGLAHLRVDLDLAGVYAPLLQQATSEARALDLQLNLALFCSDAAAGELADLAALLDRVGAPIGTWLIFQHGQSTTPAWLILAARQALGAYQPSAVFAGGTNAYFTELNRGRPELDADNAVCYSINPQVHAFDNASLIETLAAQAATVHSARQMYGSRPIIISPVTLRPRFNPNATGPQVQPEPHQLPTQVDHRQMSLFGAGWTLGSFKYLAEAGVASVTYYETSGWRGVMESEAGTALPEQFFSIAGAVFPLYHMLADLGEYSGGSVIPASSNQPLMLDGIVLERGNQRCTIVANLSQAPQFVRVMVAASTVQVRILDETNVLAAIQSPETFRALPGMEHNTPHGVLELELRPYAVARIEHNIYTHRG